MKLHTPRESFRWLKALWVHHRNSRLTRPQLEAAQLRKFRRLAALVYERSPYYRSIMEARCIDPRTCVPTDFPVLTKEEVIAHFDDIVTERSITRSRIADFVSRSTDPCERMDGRYHVLHTSGTSGTMACFAFSREAWIHGASQVVRTSSLKLRRRVAFLGATRGHFAGVSLMMAGNDGTNALFFNVRTFDVGRPMPQLIAELNEFQPDAVSAYATVLKMLGEAQERGELRINPSELGSGGESLLPEVKETLERIFKAPVKNGYASSEHLYMAIPLPGAPGLNLLEDDLIFELQPDHTCVTNLFNDVTPLIRYRLDDVLVPEDHSSSPYPFRRIREVIGRREDALLFINEHGVEDFIHPIIIVELVVPGLDAWQVVLESKTSFRFRARLEPSLTAREREQAFGAIRSRLNEILAEKEMSNVRFEIEVVDSLDIDFRTGKFRLVMQAEDVARPKNDLSRLLATSAAS
jgi:phenylacetate-coenzyme A ligase PaaK-like adenylate-forming protein